jgi:malate synthase
MEPTMLSTTMERKVERRPAPDRMKLVSGDGIPNHRILTTEALDFVGELVARFTPRRDELLALRMRRQRQLDRGGTLDFLPETRSIRERDWKVAPLPADLVDRRVEITGPVDRKMIINALNSGANVFMADFEDATSPTWANIVSGQANLADAVRRTIDWTDPLTGKRYTLADRTATLIVRPRGLHLHEAHLQHRGRAVPAALVDFGLYLFHNAHALLAAGSGPYFYLPKLESHLEARWWDDVFTDAQNLLGLPRGTIRATVLIETLPAAFEMDEILHELRDHVVGLNCGRWDYIFSYIKKLRADGTRVLPDRSQVGMTQPFLRAYTQLLVRTSHRRGALAMGGMAAQIPVKDDPTRHAEAMEKVRADKLREVKDGHDGTWVAHPALVSIAREVFDAHMPGPNQLHERREDVRVGAADLLAPPTGSHTVAGLRHNVRVGIRYLEAWLRGHGCVPLYDLMEDAATAEISRAQVWQWLAHGVTLDDGQPLTHERFEAVLWEEMEDLRREVGSERFRAGPYRAARVLFEQMCTSDHLEDFLTLPAYDLLLDFAPLARADR